VMRSAMNDETEMMQRLPRILLVLMSVTMAGTVWAGDDPGRSLYLRYCAACHGREGRGDGFVAPALGQKPTDLTQIAAEHGGRFPLDEVIDAIDGTRTVRAHGVSEMPVWGEVFRADGAFAGQARKREMVKLIADHVSTLQSPKPPSH